MEEKMKHIPVFRPSMGEEEVAAVAEVIRSGWIGLGPKVEEFEERFAEYVGAQYAVATNSGTAALHLSLLVAGVGSGDEVIVPAITFVSTALAVTYTGATPVFADVDRDTLCIDPDEIERKSTDNTKAVIPVHYGGWPCNIGKIVCKAKKRNLTVIEDAAHACGSKYGEHRVGSPLGETSRRLGFSPNRFMETLYASSMVCFSFHAVKNLATGDGGMITTSSRDVAKRLRELRWCGINKSTHDRIGGGYGWEYDVTRLGYKYHMNDITAAIGLVQLKKLDQMNERRAGIAQLYDLGLKDLKWLEVPRLYEGSSHHNYVIKTEYRDVLNLHLRDQEISTGVHYKPLYLHSHYWNLRTQTPVADAVWKTLLTLPLYPDMTDADVARVIAAIREFGDGL